MACRSCGTELRDNARFCDRCGMPIATGAGAEYKQVTALFADVVRSMDIAAAVDLERLHEIMTDLVEGAAAVVQHYGGTVENTGDGVMGLFGAPVALEDHAIRACRAALDIQQRAGRLAAEVARRDGIALRLRVGLNSGRVIAGEIGSAALGYTAIGEHVGMAQRMESAAPPGGVMLSESTARLVEHGAVLGDPEWVRIKNVDEPVQARRLLAMRPQPGVPLRTESRLIGRRREISALEALTDRAIDGHGAVVNVVGPPGIGKSRLAQELAALTAARGVAVFWTFCESHTGDVPFHAVTGLLRAGLEVADLDDEAARSRVRERIPGSVPQDLLLLDDLLGIADPEVPPPPIDPDARRRRLTALINSASLARIEPAVFVIEDVHWIDTVSESMVIDFLAVIAQTPTLVLTTSRPEYAGALTRVAGAQPITLAPLVDSETATLLDELLGPHPSVGRLAAAITERAAGNPFFAEEMVRELAQRGVLIGRRGDYACRATVIDTAVPATVQAAIEARIDRLSAPAKRTLNAASVIGTRFKADLLSRLGVDAVFDELLGVELIDHAGHAATSEYSFHHPLIRAVAYESQLKSDRAEWHRRLAAAIQAAAPESVEENSSLIAEHLQAGGELHQAYDWHMRAGGASTKRDFGAARLSWQRARQIADTLSDDDPDRLPMRIRPRTMLCASTFHAIRDGHGDFAELRGLCTAAGDDVSLAIGMTGLATELLYTGRSREGSRLASEQMALLESIGDPTLTVGLSFVAFVNWFDNGDFDEILRWTQTVIELADGDPAKGAGFGMGSPLAAALALRGVTRWWLGRPGWRPDLRDALEMAGSSDAATRALLLAWTYGLETCCGVLRADDFVLRSIEEAVQLARATSNDFGLGMAEYTLGIVLLHRDNPADRRRGLKMMAPAQDMWEDRGPHLLGVTQLAAGRELVARGDHAPIPVMRKAVDDLHGAGRHSFSLWGTGVFVETLLTRGDPADLNEAEALIERLADPRDEHASAMRDITLLRLNTLLARTRGDEAGTRDAADRYAALATSLGFEGHMAWAAAMQLQ